MLNIFRNWFSTCSWSRHSSSVSLNRAGRPHDISLHRLPIASRLPLPLRPGVTFLEVLFASGIAVFGLIGIASLIAVAGRQASDANSWSEGQSAARYALSDFVVRGYNNSASWAVFNDQINHANLANHFVPYKSMGTSIPRNTNVPGVRTDNRHAVCIDPTFFFDATTADSITVNFPSSQIYRPGLFPYYQDNYNPLDPANPLTINAARLLRVSVQSHAGTLIPALVANRQFQLLDDLAITADNTDKTLPPERVFRVLSSGATGQGLSNGEYSWFATLCPREITSPYDMTGTNYPENVSTLSVVVCKRRDRAFFVPASGQQGPLGERVVTVISTGNFKGGSGGRVILSAAYDPLDPSVDVSDSLRPGDWVMLCKEQTIAAGGLMTICRWYRVLTVDAESTINGGAWERNVVLDGPDWAFDAYPTQATLVSGVVTVVERVVPVL